MTKNARQRFEPLTVDISRTTDCWGHLLLLPPQHGRSNETFLVSLALPQDRRELAGELGRDANLLQDLAELTNQLLSRTYVLSHGPSRCTTAS
jgi:hypothetical protein